MDQASSFTGPRRRDESNWSYRISNNSALLRVDLKFGSNDDEGSVVRWTREGNR